MTCAIAWPKVRRGTIVTDIGEGLQEPAGGRHATGNADLGQHTWQRCKSGLTVNDLSPMEVARMLRNPGFAEASQLIYEQECTQ